jgi:hypothetical protein
MAVFLLRAEFEKMGQDPMFFFLAKSKQQALQYTALYMPTVGVIVILIQRMKIKINYTVKHQQIFFLKGKCTHLQM